MSPIELLTTVNDFYDQAFNRLLIVTFGIIAFIGVLVPVVVGWVQVRSLRQEKGSILNELRAEITSERTAIRESIEEAVREEMRLVRSELEKQIDSLTEELRVASSRAEARSFHLQGMNLVKAKTPHHAVKDFSRAAADYIDAKSESNAQRCINMLVSTCLPKTTMDQFKELKMQKHCDDLISKLTSENENGRYTDQITKIEREMQRASKRPSEKAETKSSA